MMALWFWLFFGLAVADEAKPETAVVSSVVLHITDADEAAEALAAQAEELGGWFQARTASQIDLRVPVERVDALLDRIEAMGKVADRQAHRQDLTREIAEIEGRLKAREAVLEKYYEVLETASAEAVVSVERQIVAVIAQIEMYRGQLRVLRDRADWARVEVRFHYRDRRAPAADGTSSFAWLNSLRIQGVIEGHRLARPDWRTRGLAIDAPQGFSAWRKLNRYRAASPDGVLFRVRTVRHRPRADLAFWQEAVSQHLRDAGYRVVEETEIRVDGVPGGLIELRAPVGEEDWAYLIAFVPHGRKVVIAEGAGEVSRFEAHRDALIEGIVGMDL